jgi:hypothetical protein
MSWNQGYGGDDVYARLNNTKDVGGARFPFIEDGKHRLALVSLEEFMHNTDGPCARAILKVLQSQKHQPGSFVVKIWKLVKPSKYPQQATDADKFADFCRKLKNAPAGYAIGNDIRVLMKERPREQLARGTMIDCTGVRNQKNTWTEVYWNAVEQTPQQIASMRGMLESEGLPDGGQGQQLPQQQQFAQAMQQNAQQGHTTVLQNPVPQAGQNSVAPAPLLAQLPPNGNGNPTGGTW